MNENRQKSLDKAGISNKKAVFKCLYLRKVGQYQVLSIFVIEL